MTQLSMVLELPVVWGHTMWATLAVAAVIGIAQGAQTYRTYMQQKHQKKLDSGRLVLDLLAVLRCDDFRQCSVRINGGKSFEISKEWITWRIRYPGHFDTICGFHYYDEIVTKRHMEELFGAFIERLWEHEEMRRYIYSDKRHYDPLKKWFEEEVKPRRP